MNLSPAVDMALDENANRLRLAAAAALAPSVEPEIVAWAERNFRLSIDDSAAPGLVVLEPWQREILTEWQKGKITVVAASSQVGKTLIGLIIAAFCIKFRPGPTRYVHENDEAALSFAQSRIEPMVRENLSGLQNKKARGRGSQTLLKFRNNSSLAIVGANSPTGLSSSPSRTIIATEVRGFPVSAGNGVRASGDPLTLALARGKSFPDFRSFVESSPGLKGACRLTKALEAGDFRKWHLACPDCGHSAPVEYEPQPDCHHVYFERGKPETAAIACHECGSLWTAAQRLDAIHNGHFKATKEPSDPSYVSFQYSELESPRSSLPDIVRRVENAKGTVREQQSAMNTILGRVFDIEEHGGIEITDENLNRHRLRYNALQILPAEVLAATAGVDVQPNRLEVQVIGHGEGKRRWSLEYKVFHGNPDGESVWIELTNFLLNTRYKSPLGGTVRIRAACIDSGGSNTQSVYAFCADALARGRQWYAIKGVAGSKPISRKSNTSLINGGAQKLTLLGVDTLKHMIFDALQSEDTQGRIFFPESYEASFFEGLTAERKVTTTDKKGRQVITFRKHHSRARNEPLDTLGYALAAFELLTPKPDFRTIKEQLSTPPEPEGGEDAFAFLNRLATGKTR